MTRRFELPSLGRVRAWLRLRGSLRRRPIVTEPALRAMLRHYTLADDDLELIHARRRSHNRFGFALQLCALRYPWRLLPFQPREHLPR